jgi:hypothetical protein
MTTAENSVTVQCPRCKKVFVMRYSSAYLDLETDDCGDDILDDYIVAVCPDCSLRICVDI